MLHRTLHPLVAMTILLAAAPAGAQTAEAPASAPASPAPASAETPVPVRVGTKAVLVVREGAAGQTIAQRAAVIQSRLNQVLLHHPYLTAADVKVLRVGQTPVVYWGPFPIVSADAGHARLNNFSSPDLLAHAWAQSLRDAVKAFFAAKKMPERALYRNPRGGDFVYRRTDKLLNQPELLRNTRYIFSPEDFEYGAGIKESGQEGFVVFVRKDADSPPEAIFLGNNEGTFTEYDLVKPEDE